MSDLKDKVKEKTESAADAAKAAVDKAAEKAKDLTHAVGKKMEQGGKKLKDV